MPCQFNMIFSRIFKNFLCKNHRGGSCHLVIRVEGAPYPPRRTPLPCGPTVALLHLFLHPCTPSSSHKHQYPAQARVLAHFAAIFNLLAQSTSHKTAWGDCSLVCDSSIGPISFCSSALFVANFSYLGDPVLELACQIYMVKSSFDA